MERMDRAVGDGGTLYPAYRWYVFVVLCVSTMASSAMMISPAPLMGVIAKNLHIELGAATAVMMATFQIGLAAFCVGGGFICDRYGLFTTFLIGSVFCTVSTILYPFVGNSVPGVITLRVLQACGTDHPGRGFWGCGSVVSAASKGVRGRGAELHDHFRSCNWIYRNSCYVCGIGKLALGHGLAVCRRFSELAVCRYFCLRSQASIRERRKGLLSDRIRPRLQVGNETGQGVSWVGLFIIFISCWVFQAFNDLTPGYFALAKPIGVGYGPMMAGKLMSLVQIAFMLGAAVTGIALEKIFRGNTRPTISVGWVLFAISAFSIIFRKVFGNMGILITDLAAAGFFLAWVVPNILAFITKHYPAHIAGKLVGMWMGLGLFGGTFGILGGATALRKTGNYHASIVIVSVFGVIGLILSQFLKPPKVFCATDELPADKAQEL